LDKQIVKTNMQTDEFNKICKCSVTILNLKFTDAITSYDDRSLYNQYYDQQTQDKEFLQSRFLVAAD